MARNRFIKNIAREVAETKQSLLRISISLKRAVGVCWHILGQPLNALYGISAAFLSVLLAMWFANIGILQTVYTSTALAFLEKIEFMFTMLGTLLRNMAPLQITLIIIHLILWCLIAGLWLEMIKIHNERPRLRSTLGPVIIATLFIGAVALLGISLVTPVITRWGISVFVSDHFSGTVLLIGAVLAEAALLKKLVKLLYRLA